MLLQTDPRLAEVPGFSREQLDALARSVEQRRQQLESDINHYIQRKQEALRSHEQELVEQFQSSMECDAKSASADKSASRNAESIEDMAAASASDEHDEPAHAQSQSPHAESQSEPQSPSDARAPPEEKAKRTKHTRVHKREKELYGLVTPVFLPLLDARDTSPTKRKEKKQPPRPERADDAPTATGAQAATPSRDGDKTAKEARKTRKEARDMDVAAHGLPAKDQHADTVKKLKRSIIKKSSLRHKDTPRSRRKRVSLVIDGQTVLPADSVTEPALTSPSSEATSASNSTASLDDMIDPRLTRPDSSVHLSHNHAVHHSLPLTMSRYTHAHAPSKPLSTQPTPAPLFIETMSPPAQLPSPRSPNIPFSGPAPQSLTRTFLDPSPVHPASLPHTDPALFNPTSDLDPDAQDPITHNDDDDDEQQWHTYVGGLHGSGVDDVDQAGSYGYPSSLGASYLESYMQNRPLSVRMVAADKAGLRGREKRGMLEERKVEETEADEEEEEGFGVEIRGRGGEEDDMEIVGSMEGF
ncbi:hypothetical protein T440DRAFT_516457 [Plenodomus tracheiphilus IPT5]|uniref:Uncharacterized protein n=1 Tax=Plenodomus tracheiphilus IPT5 TaxID=1408161 RepID=A0A6A7BD14_9PLEO|nr:hypothetical protein T440DRAFT_516457 [Plenodomus tracheiphilus IPT5]